ncbi:MAG: hypothetical protein IT307_05775 [Chloroflexi bacterium]|nr:hypothetical protein [Chloroflexota bacterium]
MKAHAVQSTAATAEDISGRVIAHTVRRSGSRAVLFRKGQVLQARDLSAVREAGGELHLLELEPGEIHENEAGARLARAVAGAHTRITGPIESQYAVLADRRGLLRVDVDALRAVNDEEGMSVFTAYDRVPVERGQALAGVKVTPIVMPADRIERVEALALNRPSVRVAPFEPAEVAALVMERVDPATVDRFERAMTAKLAWFGSRLISLDVVEDRVEGFVQALNRVREQGVDAIMAAGASSLDPLEPLFIALQAVGARIEKHGVPADPGSLFWLAYLGDTPVFGLSSCEMFSRKTILDLVLPRLLSGERVRRQDFVELGHGGQLGREMGFRFPPYDTKEGPS